MRVVHARGGGGSHVEAAGEAAVGEDERRGTGLDCHHKRQQQQSYAAVEKKPASQLLSFSLPSLSPSPPAAAAADEGKDGRVRHLIVWCRCFARSHAC